METPSEIDITYMLTQGVKDNTFPIQERRLLHRGVALLLQTYLCEMAEVVKSTRTRMIPVVAGLQVRVLPAELQRRATALYKSCQAGRRARFICERGRHGRSEMDSGVETTESAMLRTRQG